MISDYYTSTLSRYVATLTDDSFSKNTTKTWSVSGVTFKGRIETLNANEIILDESRKPLSTHRGFWANSQTTSYTDRFSDGTNMYEVYSINLVQDKSNNHHYEVGLKLV